MYVARQMTEFPWLDPRRCKFFPFFFQFLVAVRCAPAMGALLQVEGGEVVLQCPPPPSSSLLLPPPPSSSLLAMLLSFPPMRRWMVGRPGSAPGPP